MRPSALAGIRYATMIGANVEPADIVAHDDEDIGFLCAGCLCPCGGMPAGLNPRWKAADDHQNHGCKGPATGRTKRLNRAHIIHL